jgi:PKD repeat protein
MGVGYYKAVTQFSRGEYTSANNTEDDTTKINSYIPRSADLAGNDILTAVPLSGTTIDVTGIIDSRTDADLYRIDAGAGTISLSATTATPDANLDISLALYNGAGNVVASANPTTLAATLSTVVAGGTYYIAVDGIGTGPGTTGYTDYGSLGQFILTGTVPAAVGLPPVATISPTGPIRGVGPLTVAFKGSGSSDPEGSALVYDWDFGDGNGSTEADPSYTYTKNGTYTASLVVTDATGLSASASVTVSVLAPTSVVYVSGISMTKQVSKSRTSARATVTVRDAAGADVSVSGNAAVSLEVEIVDTAGGTIAVSAATGVGALARLSPRPVREWVSDRLYLSRKTMTWEPWAAQQLAQHEWRMILEAGSALGQYDARPWLPEVDVPTGIVVTTRDGVVDTERQRLLGRVIPGARVFEVDGNHDAVFARADEFVPALRAAVEVAVVPAG